MDESTDFDVSYTSQPDDQPNAAPPAALSRHAVPEDGINKRPKLEGSQDALIGESISSSESLDSWQSLGASIFSDHFLSQDTKATAPDPPSSSTLVNTTSRSVESGFTTGSNKRIFIDENKLREFQEQLLIQSPTPTAQSQHTSYTNESRLSEPEHSTHPQIREDILEAFQDVRAAFPKEDARWLAIQFKWIWMDRYMAGLAMAKIAPHPTDLFVEQMRLRQKTEESVLRHISEFDGSPSRHMVLGVLELRADSLTLFDGFYSVKALICPRLFKQLSAAGCTLGTKLHIFGAERLIVSPTDILELHAPLLRLSFNSVRVGSSSARLGAKKALSFLVKLAEIQPDGGVVSAVVVTIRAIIERRFRVQLGTYRNDVDNPEAEIEKIEGLLEKSRTGEQDCLQMNALRVTAFATVRVVDSSGDCLLQWWNPPDISVGEKYKLVYLRPIPGRDPLLSFDKRGYFERIC